MSNCENKLIAIGRASDIKQFMELLIKQMNGGETGKIFEGGVAFGEYSGGISELTINQCCERIDYSEWSLNDFLIELDEASESNSIELGYYTSSNSCLGIVNIISKNNKDLTFKHLYLTDELMHMGGLEHKNGTTNLLEIKDIATAFFEFN